jgi:predicted PolB exonuclease-like 3'-5' exonuclease
MTSEWTYQGKIITELPPKVIGFLYKITHIPTGKWYIGRKLGTKTKTTQSKGVKKKEQVSSDWKTYWSSSDELKALVSEKGENEFKREILLFCETKASMTYSEEYLLYISGALFDANCFNNNIRAKIYRKWFMKTPNLHNQLKSIKI